MVDTQSYTPNYEDEQLYCTIFVNTQLSCDELAELLCQHLQTDYRFHMIKMSFLLMFIDKNDNIYDESDTCLYYPYRLEICPMIGISRDQYISKLNELLLFLQNQNCQVASACNFEKELLS